MNGKMRVSIVATALDGQKPESKTVLNMVTRIQNRNNGYSEGSFSHNAKVENTTFNSINGATALKLDEKFEINEQEQNTLLSNIETNLPKQKIEREHDEVEKDNKENIPNGVSIESASYMENSNDSSLLDNYENENMDTNAGFNNAEEYTQKLFSDEDSLHTTNNLDENNDTYSEKLLDQDAEEEEDFEIPAFLRKQKF